MYKICIKPRQESKFPLDLLDQSFLDREGSACLSQLQGGEATEVCPGDVHLGLPHEEGHHVLQPPLHSKVKGGLAGHLILGVHIYPGLEEDTDSLHKVTLNSEMKGKLAKIIWEVGIGLN